MKIHSSILTQQDIRECVPQGCYLAAHYDRKGNWASVHKFGSRSRDASYSVRLSGSSKSAMMNIPDKAATWDEWGIFIAALFERDPRAVIGCYAGRDSFINQTASESRRINEYLPELAKTYTAPWLAHS